MVTSALTRYNNNFSLSSSQSSQSQSDQGVSSQVVQQNLNTIAGLQQILSDVSTFRCKANVNLSAGMFVGIVKGISGDTEASITPSNFSADANFVIPVGFIVQNTAAGDYAVVYRRGVNTFLTGLSPGQYYTYDVNGSVVKTIYPVYSSSFPVPNRIFNFVGFSINTNTLIVDISLQITE